MPGSGRYVNNRAVTMTPTSGSAVTYDGVTNVSITPNGSVIKFSGDADHFTTTVVNDFSDPMVTFTTANLAKALMLGVGTRGAFTSTIKDCRNQFGTTATGDITFTMLTAVIVDIPIQSAYRQFGQATVSLTGESADGVTSPITYAVST